MYKFKDFASRRSHILLHKLEEQHFQCLYQEFIQKILAFCLCFQLNLANREHFLNISGTRRHFYSVPGLFTWLLGIYLFPFPRWMPHKMVSFNHLNFKSTAPFFSSQILHSLAFTLLTLNLVCSLNQDHFYSLKSKKLHWNYVNRRNCFFVWTLSRKVLE